MTVRVLLVEDNPVDARATLKAAERLRLDHAIDLVTDGETALEHLHRDPIAGERPDMVLLDLNLPGKDGRDVLREIKGDEQLRRIPVLVLTTSSEDADIIGAYDLGANAYITKPLGLDGWSDVVARIEAFWFSLVKMPPA